MLKSSHNDIIVYNFGIPAFMSQDGTRTCPNAGHCSNGCYAQNGTYRFKNVKNAYESRYEATQKDTFIDLMVFEINIKTLKAMSQNKTCLIRIHDSGDFYSKDYAEKWFTIMKRCPNVRFYAYTKMIQLFEEFKSQNEIPNNFTLIYSFGGKQDSHIDTTKHRHSKVFQSETELLASGYIDGTSDDLVAALGPSNNIGLVYHGQKKYTNTNWRKVSK